MKNLTNRTKILLGIAGLVIVVIVAGVVIVGPGEGNLFGGSIIHISPENPTINQGQNLELSINSSGTCTWSSSNESVVNIAYFNSDYSRKVTLAAMAPGQAIIKADCTANHYTTVTVRTPPVISPAGSQITVGQRLTLSVGDTGTNCSWYIPSDQADHAYLSAPGVPDAIITQPTGPSVLVTGFTTGYAAVHVSCVNGTDSVGVSVR